MIYFRDSKAPFEHYCKQGYYIVGENKYYLFKFNALLEAKATNENITWNFNDEIYSSLDWTKSSGRTVYENYKIRAQQIRDKYDYVIISYSGGVDSTTMLDAFIDNDIKIDEIWCDWPIHLIEKAGLAITTDKHFDNIPSEFFLNTFPSLKRISEKFPEIKIHMSDAMKSPIVDDKEDTSYLTSIPVIVDIIHRHRYIYSYMTKMMDKTYKKVGLIIGCDKPIIHIKNNVIGMLFVDNAITAKSDITGEYNRLIEYFYWSEDFPQLVVDQCQAIVQHLSDYPVIFNGMEESLRTLKDVYTDRSLLYNIVIDKICYPDWDYRFQANKRPFGRTDGLRSLFNPFREHDFVTINERRMKEDLKRLGSFGSISGSDISPTPLPTYFKFYPITSVNNIRNLT